MFAIFFFPCLPPALPATLPVSTTEAFGPNAPEFYLWLPLIVVILFTGIMIGLILVGRKRDIEEAQATAEQEPGEGKGNVPWA